MAIQHPQGWIPDPQAVDDFVATLARPIFGASAPGLRESGRGKVVLLHKYVEQVAGGFPIHEQTVGDCVSHAWGLAVDVLKCVEIALHGEAEEWVAETATEPIYALSRVEVGRGKLGSGDGSIGAWAAKSVQEYGVLLRRAYGPHDLSRYSGQRARDWGRPRFGLPDELEPEAREHPVRTVSLVRTYAEARDAIANGYPVPVCSMQGFSSQRDAQGFARPSGSWAHAMCFIAADDRHARPGLLCMNSWGRWNSGPKRHDQPDGSFWVDADVADRMLGRQPDSYSLSNFDGYPSRDLNFVMI